MRLSSALGIILQAIPRRSDLLDSNRYKDLSKRIFAVAVLPLFTYLFFAILCGSLGVSGYNSMSNLQVVLRTTIYNSFIAWAFAFNLGNGRFDFSIGAVMILSNIIAAQLTNLWGLGAVGMLAMFILSGLFLGAISGLLYIVLKVSPMVSSIGITMIFEAFTSILSGGKGVIMIGRNDLLIFASNPAIYLLCLAGLAVVIFISKYTAFGFHFSSLGGGQSVSVSVGINEKKNAVLCYILAGGLMACAGIINFSILGTCQPKSGLSSASYMMNAFLPLFIGMSLGRYTDRNFGIMIGALTQAVITSGFTKLGITSTLQSVLNAVIVLGFLFVEANSYRVIERRMFMVKRRLLGLQKIK
ncbi:MAG: ABC transporter permease [Mobilitalea sp.]